jgi:hypothetical protein
MGDARRAIVIGVLALARAAAAAGGCEEGRAQTGVALALRPDGLAVAAVDADTPAAASGAAAGDVVAQVNGSVPTGCAEWARAVREARHDRKALLLLVHRGGSDVPLVLAASAWSRAPAAVAVAAPEPPTVRQLVSAPPPAALPPETTVTLDQVTTGLAALPTDGRADARLARYSDDLQRIDREVATLAARSSVAPDVLDGLRTVVGYFDAAGAAWASEEAERARQGRPRHIPFPESTTAPFFEDSEIAAAIDRYPFLRATVVRDPARNGIGLESAGLWRPRAARTLLWDHGRDELDRLTRWLTAAGR